MSAAAKLEVVPALGPEPESDELLDALGLEVARATAAAELRVRSAIDVNSVIPREELVEGAERLIEENVRRGQAGRGCKRCSR